MAQTATDYFEDVNYDVINHAEQMADTIDV